jgi:hypothetical protein
MYLGGTGFDRILGYRLPTKDIHGFAGVCSREYQIRIHLKMLKIHYYCKTCNHFILKMQL